MVLKADCRHFPGDRPCVYNKQFGMLCDHCVFYKTPKSRILIIKLDAAGDVLRTTCILQPLREAYPECEITWVTRRISLPLLENNPLIDRLLTYEDSDIAMYMLAEHFDVVISPDNSKETALLSSTTAAEKRYGFTYTPQGKIKALSTAAEHWMELGAFDQRKRQNITSYQDILLAICDLPSYNKNLVLELTPEELKYAHLRIPNNGKRVVGINTGASYRWQLKQWTIEGWKSLIAKLYKDDVYIALYGGPQESERNEELLHFFPNMFDMGTNNTLRQFFALLTLSDVIVTGDTLAMHAATALGKKIVAYFGPTSSAEIYDYHGQILKVTSDMPCLVCYKQKCDFDPNCMNTLSATKMYDAITKQLNKL